MKIRLSIIIPSVGRPTLCRTIQSVIDGGFSKEDDQLIVVSDGPNQEVRRIVQSFKSSIDVSDIEGPLTRCFGNSQRMVGMKIAQGTHLMFIDDDDEYVQGALTLVRTVVSENPDRLHLFKMLALVSRQFTGCLWRSKDVVVGNVGTPIIVAPNVAGKLGIWGENDVGDFEFIQSTSLLHGNGNSGIVWVDKVIAKIH